jgi:hypothetical protein
VKRAGTEFERGLKGEALCVRQPVSVVLESCVLAILPYPRPQAPDKVRGSPKVDVNKGFPVQLSILGSRRFSFGARGGKANSLRELFFFEFTSHLVLCGVGKIRDTMNQTERKKHGRIVSGMNACIAVLEPVECHAAHRRALCKQGRGYPPPPPGIADIVSEFAKGP